MCRWCCWGRRRRTPCRSSGCTAPPPARSSCSRCWRSSACASSAAAAARTPAAAPERSRRAARRSRKGSDPRGLQIRVAVELALVEALEGLALRECHAPVADGALAVARQRRVQLRDVVLHVFEHLVGRVALDDLFDPPAAFIVQAHVHHVGVAKEIVQVAERLLVGADQERRQVVPLVRPELMQLERALHVTQRHEVIDLAIGVAGDVGEHGGAGGTLLQAVYGQDREQVVDRPAVRERLEHREVAEIGVRENRLQVLELLRQTLELAAGVADLRAGGPVQPLGECAELERQQAEIEHLQHLLAGGEGVVIALDQAPLAHRTMGPEQALPRLRQSLVTAVVLGPVPGDPELIERRGAERIEDQHAVAAYHSVLIFDALGSSALDKFRVTGDRAEDYGGDEGLPQPGQGLFGAHRAVSERRLVECYHDALTAREQVLQMFNLGLLSLEFRALAERLYWATCAKIRDSCRKLERLPEELEDLESILSDTYFCNFSVFQSLPDSWAIDQLFPILPIHRLHERPTRTAVLADITCDSDGKIDHFVSLRDVKRTLELHELRADERYYLAVFLVGAYQETLGDLHNLFGDTHVVHVRLHDEGGWWIEEIVKGDTANKVLEYMEYDVAELYPALARDCERAIRDGRMTLAQSQALKRFYESELDGYAYLEPAGT